MPNAPAPQLVRQFGFRDDQFRTLFEEGHYPDVEFDPRQEGHFAELISGRLSGSEDLNFGVARFFPGEYDIRHHHPDGSELYFFLSGECVVTVDDEEVHAKRGTAIFLPPNCVHSVRCVGNEPADLVWALAKPEYADIGLEIDE